MGLALNCLGRSERRRRRTAFVLSPELSSPSSLEEEARCIPLESDVAHRLQCSGSPDPSLLAACR